MKGGKIRKVSGGPLASRGFVGGVASCFIKGHGEPRDDLALIVSERPAVAGGVFTRNRVKAAPVLLSQAHLRAASHRAIVLNSGNANACTGAGGALSASRMAQAVATRLGVTAKEVLVCSTGRIGIQLPIGRIEGAIAGLRLKRGGAEACARAIMTSDTFPKLAAVEVSCAAGPFRIGAMAKGAGMIRPDMATMLCAVTTDARLTRSDLRKALRHAVDQSFNRITVDGDMSTNDTVLALANAASGCAPPSALFTEALGQVCAMLARMIVRDGEGVSRFVEVNVSGAASAGDARRAAEAVANSTLVKCAWAGGDPNWGRIMDALGYSGAKLREDKVEIDYDNLPIVRGGVLADTPWSRLVAIARRPAFRVGIRLGLGSGTHEVWTTDLTEEYVRLNLGE